MSVNELSYIQFRQVVSVLASINLLSDYVDAPVRPKWYFEQSETDDAQRAALTELLDASPVMTTLTHESNIKPLMINLAEPSGYLPRECGLVALSDVNTLTMSIGDPSLYLDSQQISAFNTFIRRLKNKSELVARGGAAFENVAIKFEEGDDLIRNTIVEFKDGKGETIFVADGDTHENVKHNLPKNYLSELSEFVAQTMMTSEDDDSLFNELLGVPSKSQQNDEPATKQEAHPQWGTW